eukprot:Rmarinus@m.24040
MGGNQSRARAQSAQSDIATDEIPSDINETLKRVIPLVHAGDLDTQRETASLLANLAVKDENQVKIVNAGGLMLLIPLSKSEDMEVQRLSAHALANLAVNSENRQKNC